MSSDIEKKNIEIIINNIGNITKYFKNIDSILESNINDKINFFLLGECTHGTEEFYRIRSDITKKLIEKYNYKLNKIK